MKKKIQNILQQVLGFERYLYWFAQFKIKTFKWDIQEKDFFHFLKLLKPTSHVLDIGSNIGVTTFHLARQVPKGKVYSFEPIPPNFQTLEKIKEHYRLQNVELFQLAIGDENAEVEMVMPEIEQVQMQGLSHVVHEALTDFNEGQKFKATLRKLDSLDIFNGQSIDGIKLDIENFEYFALKGGQLLIEKHQPIIYAELWENDNRYQCFDFMRTIGYTIHVLNGKGLVQYNAQKHTRQNFFFLPK